MKRKISAEFKKARIEMRENKVRCHNCSDYATELHHILAVEDGGTDDVENLMPLCRECHREYTSDQTNERNMLWVQLTVDGDGEATAQYKGEQAVALGNLENVGSKQERQEPSTTNQVHYEYEWIVTIEIPANSEQESKRKLEKFKTELFERYAASDDVWLTRIRRYDGP